MQLTLAPEIPHQPIEEAQPETTFTERMRLLVGGLPGSGIERLASLLATLRAANTFRGEDGAHLSGASLQDVLPSPLRFGGIGVWGRTPDAFQCQHEADKASRDRLVKQWSAVAPASPHLFDASPTHLLSLPFLARTFPRATMAVTVRHPLEVAYAIRQQTGIEDWPLEDLVSYWVTVHSKVRETLRQLPRALVLSDYDLRNYTRHYFDTLAATSGLPTEGLVPRVGSDGGDDAWACISKEPDQTRLALERLEGPVRSLGFSLEHPTPLGPLLEPRSTEKVAIQIPESRPLLPRRWLAVSFGTRGDIQPLLALGREFVARGHEFTLLTTADHEPLVRRADLQFESLGEGSCFLLPEHFSGSAEQQSAAFFSSLRDFYERHGTELIQSLRELAPQVDGFIVGSCVFFRELLSDYFDKPVVNASFSPLFCGSSEDVVGESLRAYGENVLRHGHASTAYGIDATLDQVYRDAGLDHQQRADGTLRALIGMRCSLTLNAFPRSIKNHVPGLPYSTSGFWRLDNTEIDEELESCLDSGPRPICVNFGSMRVFDDRSCPWAKPFLRWLESTEERCLIIGTGVPEGVKRWATVVPYANHERIFPKCALVVHHGGAGTTAAVARAGIPSVVHPILSWSDQPEWGRWLESKNAGILVHTHQDLPLAIRQCLLDPRLRLGAQALGIELRGEGNGAARAVDAIEAHFSSENPGINSSVAVLEALARTPISAAAKLQRALPVVLDEAGSSPRQLTERSESLANILADGARKYPMYKADWPRRDEPIDATVADLPHEQALQEWWYFHAHLQAESGAELSVFSALFERAIAEVRLGHVHSSIVDSTHGKHSTRSVADPRIPGRAGPLLARSRPRAHVSLALSELFAAQQVPLPDRCAEAPFSIARDRFEFDAGPMRLRRDGRGYRVTFNDGDHSYDLSFFPKKPIVRNGVDGVVHGPTSADNMFYYSLTRMRVLGTVSTGGRTERVCGSGWYDHEFGGDIEERTRGMHPHDYAWTWLGLQLDDGTELVFANLANRSKDDIEGLHVDEVVAIDVSGEARVLPASLTPNRYWTSARTFVEYETGWSLRVPDLDLEFDIEAALDDQELISVIADPAYWEGRVHVRGTSGSRQITGLGFCEQVGRAGPRDDYRRHLGNVSREVLRQVDRTAPFDLSFSQMRDLAADQEFEGLLAGVGEKDFVESIVRPVRAISDRGGKGWRSMGFMLCADAVGGDPERLRRFLAFPEMLHTGSLIVDDIEDGSLSRRGGPTCHHEFGLATALNAGNAAYFMGERFIREIDAPDATKLRLYKLYFTCMRGAHTGQALDIRGLRDLVPNAVKSEDFAPLWERIIAIHRLKSGVPAMTAARLGVVVAGGSPGQEDALGDYFLALGLAFQLVDDVINVNGFSGNLKDQGEDLLAGKITAPVVHALRYSSARDRVALWEALNDEPMNLEVIGEYLRQTDSLSWCHQEARRIVESAWSAVDAMIPASQAKISLRAFGHFVVDVRDY